MRLLHTPLILALPPTSEFHAPTPNAPATLTGEPYTLRATFMGKDMVPKERLRRSRTDAIFNLLISPPLRLTPVFPPPGLSRYPTTNPHPYERPRIRTKPTDEVCSLRERSPPPLLVQPPYL